MIKGVSSLIHIPFSSEKEQEEMIIYAYLSLLDDLIKMYEWTSLFSMRIQFTSGLIENIIEKEVFCLPEMKKIIMNRMKEVCNISFYMVMNSGEEKKGGVAVSVAIKRPNQYAGNITIKNEKSIRVSIMGEAWKQTNVDRYVSIITETSCYTKASYSCMDEANYVPPNVYLGQFRKYCYNCHKIDIESLVPGVYWGQLIHKSRLNCGLNELIKIATDNHILNRISEDGNRVWLQIAGDVEKIKIIDRLRMRKVLSDSLYPLDTTIVINRSLNMIFRYEDYKLMPFNEKEIEKLASMGMYIGSNLNRHYNKITYDDESIKKATVKKMCIVEA